MSWSNVYRGLAVCAALNGFMPLVQAAVDPGFNVSGVTVTTSTDLGGGSGSNSAVENAGNEWKDPVGGPVAVTTPAQVGVPGKLELIQNYKHYKQDYLYDSYSFSGLQSTDNLFRVGNSVSFSGVITVSPSSFLFGQTLYVQATLDGQYQSSQSGPVPGCCAPAAPSYFLRLNGGEWQPLVTSASFSPDQTDDGGDGRFYSSSSTSFGSNLYAASSQLTFEVLVYAGALTNIDNFSLSIDAGKWGVEVPDGTSQVVLASAEIPALPAPVDEPSHLALALAGGGILASVMRRRAMATRGH